MKYASIDVYMYALLSNILLLKEKAKLHFWRKIFFQVMLQMENLRRVSYHCKITKLQIYLMHVYM